jgi:predicted aspartyl protease
MLKARGGWIAALAAAAAVSGNDTRAGPDSLYSVIVITFHHARIPRGLLGILLAISIAGGSERTASQPQPTYTLPRSVLPELSVPGPASPAPAASARAAPAMPVPSPVPPATPPAAAPTGEAQLTEFIVEAREPRFVARTTRDRIGRIWAPVFIDGKGPFRLVLDTGANHSAVIPSTAAAIGSHGTASAIVVTGFTGSAVVPTIAVSRMEVGDLLYGPTTLPVVADVFGGAQGVLGDEGLTGKRIMADFRHDVLVISRSHNEPARVGYNVIPFKLTDDGRPVAEVRVGGIRCKAIIDTGAQGTVGNLPLQAALARRLIRATKRTDVEGVTLDVQSGDNVPAPEIEMGGLVITGVRIIFGDMYVFQHWHMTDKPVLLLGMDLLGSFDVLIMDYQMRQMQVLLTHPQLNQY